MLTSPQKVHALSLIVLLLSLGGIACAAVAGSWSNAQSIENAISRAPPDVRGQLNRCVDKWELYPNSREAFNQILARADSSELVLTLEIGNAGFGRHEYLLVDGNIIDSSFPNLPGKTRKNIRKLYREFASQQAHDLADAGLPQMDDADCYFLTVSRQGRQETLAVYGRPGKSRGGRLISEIMDLIAGRRW